MFDWCIFLDHDELILCVYQIDKDFFNSGQQMIRIPIKAIQEKLKKLNIEVS